MFNQLNAFVYELPKLALVFQYPSREHRIFLLCVSLGEVFQMVDIALHKEIVENFSGEFERDSKLPT